MFRFTVWGQTDENTPSARFRFFLTVHHSETIGDCDDEDEDRSCRLTASQLTKGDIYYKSKRRHIGGTFVERLATGDWVAIFQGYESAGFLYSGDGGGPLIFRGELIATSNFDA